MVGGLKPTQAAPSLLKRQTQENWFLDISSGYGCPGVVPKGTFDTSPALKRRAIFVPPLRGDEPTENVEEPENFTLCKQK
jgi:hypothetical protein